MSMEQRLRGAAIAEFNALLLKNAASQEPQSPSQEQEKPQPIVDVISPVAGAAAIKGAE